MDSSSRSPQAEELAPDGQESRSPCGWNKLAIARIEDLSDAVLGAGLHAVQMSTTPVSGSLLFAELDGMTFSSGFIHGHVELIGPLSQTHFTVGVALRLAPGARHWMHEVASGDMGVFMAGDEHDSIYFPGSLYATVTLTEERAEEIGAGLGRVIEVRKLGGTSIIPQRIRPQELQSLRADFEAAHATGGGSPRMAEALLTSLLEQLGRLPRQRPGHTDHGSRVRIVRRCREYITANLHGDLSLEALARATDTSTRTLFRAFTQLLGETPMHYVRRLRLHRIREDLLMRRASGDSVTVIATRWGVNELGRFAGWYRAMFGERPSET